MVVGGDNDDDDMSVMICQVMICQGNSRKYYYYDLNYSLLNLLTGFQFFILLNI